jgi:hypothetical protein
MIEMYAIIGVAMLAAGIVIGIFTIVSIGTRREERIFRTERIVSLRDVRSPGKAESAARAFYGHYAVAVAPTAQQRQNSATGEQSW